MDWTKFDIDRFAKIMALAISADGNEALVALNKARGFLAKANGSFEHIAEIMRGYPQAQAVLHSPPAPPERRRADDHAALILSERLTKSEARVKELEKELEMYRTQLDEAVRYVMKIEAEINQLRGLRKQA